MCSGSRSAGETCLRFDSRARWPRAAGLAVGAVAAIYLIEAIVSIIPLPESPGKEQGLTPTHWEPAHAGAFAANVVLYALVAPVVEELTFRGLGQSLLAFLGRWPSIVVVGISFGLAHGLVEALLVLVPFGIALAWLRDRTKSVYPGMVVHGLFNGVALAVAVLTYVLFLFGSSTSSSSPSSTSANWSGVTSSRKLRNFATSSSSRSWSISSPSNSIADSSMTRSAAKIGASARIASAIASDGRESISISPPSCCSVICA